MDLIFALLLAANVSMAHAVPAKPAKPIHRPSIVRTVKPHILVTSKQLHRMHDDSDDADGDTDVLPSPEVVAKPRKGSKLDEKVRQRLTAARLLALVKHRDTWGLTHPNQACYSS
jgi:hypothetical protein